MKFKLLILIFALWLPAASQLSSVAGTVTAVEKTSKTISITTDQNATFTIKANDKTVCLRVPAGAQSLEQATAIGFDEIVAGDRVSARGSRDEQNGFSAVRIVVISKDEIAKRRERDLEQWRTRGIAGVVKAVNPATAEINIELRGSAAGSVLTINTSGSEFRRYTTTSINFENTKQSDFAEISVGDQLRALGDKSADGKSFKAQAIVSGSFRTIGATLTAIDLEKREISATTLDQKKPIHIGTLKESLIHRIPAALVPTIAQKARAASQTGEVQKLIDALPGAALSELKVGDVVSITGIREKDDSRMTAIKVVAGVDAVLKAMTQPGRPQTVRLSAGLPNAFDFSVIPAP
ncbi:MAG TPA: DUF5666 domain-containing protein [Pyrinomonadaceae bacterium]|nr:DUF5666 domain-containing protein [Pyrinomonadaceae bacterium]